MQFAEINIKCTKASESGCSNFSRFFFFSLNASGLHWGRVWSGLVWAEPGQAGPGRRMRQTGQYEPHVAGCARRPHESGRGRGVRGGPGTSPIQIRPDLNIQAEGGPGSNSPNPDHPKVTLWSRRRQMTRRHRTGRKWNQLRRCSIQERRRNCLVGSRRKKVLVHCRKGRIVFFRRGLRPRRTYKAGGSVVFIGFCQAASRRSKHKQSETRSTGTALAGTGGRRRVRGENTDKHTQAERPALQIITR